MENSSDYESDYLFAQRAQAALLSFGLTKYKRLGRRQRFRRWLSTSPAWMTDFGSTFPQQAIHQPILPQPDCFSTQPAPGLVAAGLGVYWLK